MEVETTGQAREMAKRVDESWTAWNNGCSKTKVSENQLHE